MFLAYSVCSFSQLPCYDNYKIDMTALQKAREFESRNSLNNGIQSSAGFVIRVYFHILNCNDGTLPGATPAQLTTEFNTLATAYSADNICFINAGFDNIYNSKLDSNFQVGTDNAALFTPYQVPDCINIFYPFQIDGSNASCSGSCGFGGVTLGIPDTFCLVAKSNVGQAQTIAHEVGHCFGLLHPFDHTNGYEDINGSNSSTAGDLIKDTPADPYAYIGQSCFTTSSNGCTYTGFCTDPKGSTNFSPLYANLMTYWWAGKGGTCYTSLTLTNGQYTRANSFLNTYSGLNNCESPSYVTESGVSISSGYLMASAINTLTTSGTVSINGSATSLLGGTMATLEPGFDAYAYNGASVLIRLSQCSGTTNFAITAEKVKPVMNAPDGLNTLVTYPNPTSSSVKITYTLAHNESKLVLRVYDIYMKPIKEILLQNIFQGKNTVNVDLSNFSSGIYAITIQGPDILMKALVEVQK